MFKKIIGNKTFSGILFPAIAVIIGICFYNLQVTGFDLQFVPGDKGDSRFINYLLEHGFQYISGNESHFWDAPFMYPQKQVLAFSDNMIGTLPVYSFYRFFGYDRETSYQLWWISVSALNFICCYIVLLKLTQNQLISCCGAFIFAFGLFNQSQMSYLQMNIRFAVPFIFYHAWKIVSKPDIKNYLFYCIWTIIQFYCVIYTGIMCFYLSIIFILIGIIIYKNYKLPLFYLGKKQILPFLLVSLSTVFFLYILISPYIEITAITGLRQFNEVAPTLPLIDSYFFAHDSSIPWNFMSRHLQTKVNDWWLHTIFVGFVPMLSFFTSGFVLLYSRIKKLPLNRVLLLFFTISLVVFILFTRTQNQQTFYKLLFNFPGMNAMRVLVRVMHVELFLLVATFALIAVYLVQKTTKMTVLVFTLILPFLVMGDNLFNPELSVRTPKLELQQRIAPIIKQAQFSKKKILVVINESLIYHAHLTHLDGMISAQQLHMKSLNGYTSYCPGDFGPFYLQSGRKELEKWLVSRKQDTSEVLFITIKN